MYHQNNVFKRTVSLALALLLSLSSLGGCGKRGGESTAPAESSLPPESSTQEEETRFKVSFSCYPEDAAQAPKRQRVRAGEKAAMPEVKAEERYSFVAWFRKDGRLLPYDFKTPVTEDVELVAYFLGEEDTDDGDEDGLPDALERFLKTDAEKEDTDGDGLSDGLELMKLSLDPRAKDTDGNGKPDGKEDYDGDGLANAAEAEYGCSAVLFDTDADGLGDGDELMQYHTDPLLADTDGDGVADGDEAELGSDPTKEETAFATSVNLGETDGNSPVSIAVTAHTDAEGAGTLHIEQLVSTDIPALSAGSLGYIAPGYTITAQGELYEAQLCFSYDPELAEGRESFEPAIYWYDEEASELIEVPGQIREDGSVTAIVTHFSDYILLDKSMKDLFYEALGIPTPEEMAVDENGDGLPDILVSWLNEGRLKYDNTYLLAGVLDMYGAESDDWDEDGLKNGEEIEFGVSLFGVSMTIRSNPLLIDTDGDGISDYDEIVTLGTSPKKYNYQAESPYHQLMNNAKYSYATHRTGGEEEFGLAIDLNKQEEAKTCMINYLYDYAPEDTLRQNAEKIAELEMHNEAVKMLGLVSEMASLYKSAWSLYETDKKIDELKNDPLEKVYSDNINLKKDMIKAKNERRDDALIKSMRLFSVPDKMQELTKKLQGDNYSKIEGITKVIGACKDMMSFYQSALKLHKFNVSDELAVFAKSQKKLKGSTSKAVGTTLTVACDVLEGVEDIAEIQLTYGKIKANLAAYNRYLEMLIYVKENAADDYVRNAADDLAKMVLDTGDEYDNQLRNACIASGTKALAKTAIDATAKYNSYAAIASAFISLYGLTGIEEMQKYNIYFKVMREISNGCRSQLNAMVKVEGDTFCFEINKYPFVRDYLVQLAQSRIVGEYYKYEYISEDSILSWLAFLNPAYKTKTPAEYAADGKERIKTIYGYANRMHLPLSKNLPYYSDFFDPNVQEDHIHIVRTPARALREAAGIYVLSSGAGAWETRLELKKDGSFTGYYYDMNMGESGQTAGGEHYDASVYERNFRGRFEAGEALDDYSYRLVLAEYHIEGTDGEEYIDYTSGATRHINSPAAGLEGWTEYVLYDPDTPSSMLKYQPWTLFGREQDCVIGFGDKDGIRSYFCRIGTREYESYSTAYLAFLSGKQYLGRGQRFGNDVEPAYALHDMDGDGIPELILTNGFAARTERCAYVYTFNMGQVQYLGIGPTDAYVIPDARFPGLFGKYESNWNYYTKKLFEIGVERFAEGSFDPPYTQLTENDALMEAFTKGPRTYLFAP